MQRNFWKRKRESPDTPYASVPVTAADWPRHNLGTGCRLLPKLAGRQALAFMLGGSFAAAPTKDGPQRSDYGHNLFPVVSGGLRKFVTQADRVKHLDYRPRRRSDAPRAAAAAVLRARHVMSELRYSGRNTAPVPLEGACSPCCASRLFYLTTTDSRRQHHSLWAAALPAGTPSRVVCRSC